MQLAEFAIGQDFTTGSGRIFRCTDIGTRTVIGVPHKANAAKEGWLAGPPYAAAEIVFDEIDLPQCRPVRGSAE